MARRSDAPSRSEITERIDKTREDMQETEQEMDTTVCDIETIRGTLDALEGGGTAEGGDEVESLIESAENETVDVFDGQDADLEQLQQEGSAGAFRGGGIRPGETLGRERRDRNGCSSRRVSGREGKLDARYRLSGGAIDTFTGRDGRERSRSAAIRATRADENRRIACQSRFLRQIKALLWRGMCREEGR